MPSPTPGMLTARSRGSESTAIRWRFGSRRTSTIVSESGLAPSLPSIERFERWSEPSTSSVRGPPGFGIRSGCTRTVGAGVTPGGSGGLTMLSNWNQAAPATAVPAQTITITPAARAFASNRAPTRGGRSWRSGPLRIPPRSYPPRRNFRRHGLLRASGDRTTYNPRGRRARRRRRRAPGPGAGHPPAEAAPEDDPLPAGDRQGVPFGRPRGHRRPAALRRHRPLQGHARLLPLAEGHVVVPHEARGGRVRGPRAGGHPRRPDLGRRARRQGTALERGAHPGDRPAEAQRAAARAPRRAARRVRRRRHVDLAAAQERGRRRRGDRRARPRRRP